MSPDVNDHGFRNINFDALRDDYLVSIEALLKSDVDIILIQTIFHTINGKEALMAMSYLERKKNITVEIENLKQLNQILGLKFKRILFDNMSSKQLKKCLKICKNNYETCAESFYTLPFSAQYSC